MDLGLQKPWEERRELCDCLALVEACVRGDRSAWSGFVDLYEARVNRSVGCFRLPSEVAGDIQQDFWLHLFGSNGLRKYKVFEGATFDAWLSVVVRRFCLNWLRKKGIHSERFELQPMDVLDEGHSGPVRDLLVLLEIYSYFELLEPLERRVLSLRLEGFSHAEIAERCGISPENSATILCRCRPVLRKNRRDGL